jgi:hypothetical protein
MFQSMNILDRLRLAWAKRGQDRQIRRHGWTGVYVGDYRTAPTWAYTIGFDETLDHPEIVVFDVTQGAASQLFWRVFHEVRAGELRIDDGLKWPPEEPRCTWRKVHPDQLDEWLTLACIRRFDRTGIRRGLEAYQFVLSDPQGAMPWDSGYDERLRERQPALYDAPPGRPADAGPRE